MLGPAIGTQNGLSVHFNYLLNKQIKIIRIKCSNQSDPKSGSKEFWKPNKFIMYTLCLHHEKESSNF